VTHGYWRFSRYGARQGSNDLAVLKQGLPKNRVIMTHAMQMNVLHGLKVFAFVTAGFPFVQYGLSLPS
jgi:hypothetical protein